MQLAALVATEQQVSPHAIMLLRHASGSAERLRRHGATLEEYTALQPIDSKYDYHRTGSEQIAIVVVIVGDRVFGVFRVAGVDAAGTNFTLASAAYLSFDAGSREVASRRFLLERLPSVAAGLGVRGWESRTRTPVQRFGDSFFDEITVESEGGILPERSVENAFAAQVRQSLEDRTDERRRRLSWAPKLPPRVAVTSVVFVRNPDVVAEVLVRADGACEACTRPAPFRRRSDGSPYLEVHHRVPLAAGGEDTVVNAVALCPNCHRAAHYA